MSLDQIKAINSSIQADLDKRAFGRFFDSITAIRVGASLNIKYVVNGALSDSDHTYQYDDILVWDHIKEQAVYRVAKGIVDNGFRIAGQYR